MLKQYPDFFDAAPAILMHDPLAEFLGAARDGLIEYHYADAVMLAGHSCPTVAAAFLMTRAALAALYPKRTPERGAVRVLWREPYTAGVTGVMANVAALITGAAADGGFKGIGGRFERRGLLGFDVSLDAEARFTRLDNGATVDASAKLHRVPLAPEVHTLLPRCLTGAADAEERARFKALWQGRVRQLLLEHADDPEVIAVHRLREIAA
ncbi:MAG TPA: hypothetical protein VFL54_01715 [Gammaproteobacteria bacterium]|jgi:hypothetical protein|nr:hypothetical protein [Gammaproteobacteria bacterium]